MWAAEHYGIRPDMLVFGKGVGGGFPLAGVLARADEARFAAGDDQLTFGQFPISIAAGLAAVRAIIEDDLPANARALGEHATARLRALQQRTNIIGDVRSPGLMVSFEVVTDQESKTPAPKESNEIFRRAQARGVILGESRYAGLGNLIKIKPPLDISQELLDQALDVVDEVVLEVARDFGHGS
jgi:4-aminobutyrate aminotransferase-like enzyme